MNTAVIKLAGDDITDDVEVASARFQAVVNGSIGPCSFRIKDAEHTYEPIVGQRVSLEINGSLRWIGFASEVAEEYAFVVEDTTDGKHETLTRFWAISGVDDNILFDKRFIWDQANPATKIDFQYLPGTYDDTIIKDIVEHYLNLAGDNISAEGVQRVRAAIRDIPGVITLKSTTAHNSDWEGVVHTGTVASAGYSWKQVMDIIQRATGGIYFMDAITDPGTRILRYHDVDTITSDYALTDTPDTAVVLDPALSPPLITSDNFNRIEASGADSGLGLGPNYTPSTWSTVWPSFADNETFLDGFAIHMPGAGGDNYDSWYVNDIVVPDAGTAQFDMFMPAVVDPGHPTAGLILVTPGGTIAFYGGSSGTDGSMRMDLYCGFNQETGYTTVTPGSTATVKVEWAADGSAQMKIWEAGTTEPDWQVVNTTNDAADWGLDPGQTVMFDLSEPPPTGDLVIDNLVIEGVMAEASNVDSFDDRTLTPATTGTTRLGAHPVAVVAYRTPSVYHAAIGVEDGVAVIEIEVGDEDFTNGGGYLDLATSGTVFEFKFQVSAVPSSPGPQIDSDNDDVGWRSWIEFDIYQGLNYRAQLRIGSYAPPEWGPSQGGPYPIEDFENPGVGLLKGTGGADERIDVLKTDWLADTWYTVKQEYDPDSGIHRIKVWESDSPEPSTWLLERDSTGETGYDTSVPIVNTYGWEIYHRVYYWDQPGTDTATVNLDDVNPGLGGSSETGIDPPTADNRWNFEGADPDHVVAKGYREFRITKSGQALVNHMHIWGAALGADLMVHAVHEDATSIAEHNRWEEGFFTVGLYRQTSANLVAESWVDGTPQGKRGHKNDKVTVTCRTFMSVFRVGEVVAFRNSIFDFEDALPIRSMLVSFRAGWLPIFDLTLSHEIDAPWSFYESLRRKPRPIEVGRHPWSFPYPNPRLCPEPTLGQATGIGVGAMLSIHQQDFLGEDVDQDDPPLWQNPPFGGAWFEFGEGVEQPHSLTETIIVPGTPFAGYVVGPSMMLRTPATGAIEVLIAAKLKSDTTNAILGFSIDLGGPSWSISLVSGEWIVTGMLLVERISDGDLISLGTYVDTAIVSSRTLRGPLWIRALKNPGEGAWIKIWPQKKPEPAAWTLFLDEDDIPTDPYDIGATTFQNLGAWNMVADNLALSMGSEDENTHTGIEAIAVFAEHGFDEPLHGIAWNTHTDGSITGHYSTGSGPPGGEYNTGMYTIPTPPVGGYVYFWGDYPGSFSDARFTADASGEGTWPNHVLTFAWPHFWFDPWYPELTLLAQVYHSIVSYRIGFTFPRNPDGTTADPGDPPIDFVQKLPETIRIKGEVRVTMSAGIMGPSGVGSPNNLPFEVVLSFNYYGFGDGNPFWSTPYEALPVARQYFNYNPAVHGFVPTATRYWMPFEFDIPMAAGGYEAGEYLQWGVTFVGDLEEYLQDQMYAYNVSIGNMGGAPPGENMLPNAGGFGLEFRHLQYLSGYLTDEVGTYFCVPKRGHATVGHDTLRPAYDTGDHMTYALASAFVAGSTTVYVNGVVMQYGADEDYLENPAAGGIIFNYELDPDDEVAVDYEGIGPYQVDFVP